VSAPNRPFVIVQDAAQLAGSHSKLELPSILVFLVRKRMTGRLTVGSDSHVRAISVAMGVISSVSSTSEEEQFAARLLARDKISAEDKLRADACANAEHTRIGAAMVKLKIVDAVGLSELLAEQHAFVLGQCLSEENLDIHFDGAVKGLADRSPVKLLSAIEEAVAKFSRKEMNAIAQQLTAQTFQASPADSELARSLGASPAMLALLDRANSPQDFAALEVLAGKSKPRLVAAILSGFIRSTGAAPIKLTRRTDRSSRWLAPFAAGLAVGAALVELAHRLR
jgi:hypothetical protein